MRHTLRWLHRQLFGDNTPLQNHFCKSQHVCSLLNGSPQRLICACDLAWGLILKRLVPFLDEIILISADLGPKSGGHTTVSLLVAIYDEHFG